MDIAPDLDLLTHDGTRWGMRAALADGPVVVVFYRGDW